MKLSVCIDAVYNGWDPAEVMRELKTLGVGAVEFWSWWDKDVERIDILRREFDIKICAFCTKMVSLTDSSQRAVYLAGLKETILVAKKLGCGLVISQVGNEITDVPRETQHMSIVDGLKMCAPMLEGEGITLVFEPLNILVDHAGYYLWQSDEAAEIVSEVGSPNVRMLFDIYHQQVMEGDVIRRSIKLLGAIGHMHAAGNPGRRELDIGEINYSNVFTALETAGYAGYVGLEYFPERDPNNGLVPWHRYF